MKKVWMLEGLGCANCAAKMERAIGAVQGVLNISVNFMTTKLTVEAEDAQMAAVSEAVEKIVKKIEPDVVMKKV